MAWGAYSALPRPVNTEKRLQAAQTFPKLKMETRADEPLLSESPPTSLLEPPLAESIQVAAMPPPPPPFEPGAPSPAPVKIELPAPTPEPIKIDLPPVPIPAPVPAPMNV